MIRVVVVGNGMVGARFVEELARHRDLFEIAVLGAEEYEPYNRVLLSEVVAGRVPVASLTLPVTALDGVTVARGLEVAWIDRDARVVTATDGSHVRYDVLVLATGARARWPDIDGLDPGRPPAGVHALRSLDDAREIVAATVNARHAVVLGAGVLGLEVACGLAGRGLHVTVVHRGGHVMDRQLGSEPAAAVAHGLDLLHIEQRVGARTSALHVVDGQVRAVVLEDGARIATDLLVVAAGTVPESELAARAGLVTRRGVVVGADGATSDPAIYAIGDCAEPPEGGSGLIAQGWDQARRLAGLLAVGARSAPGPAADGAASADVSAAADLTADAGPSGGVDVVRLKAHGLEVVTMGVRGGGPGRRAVQLSDPASGRYVEVVVAGGVVVGATCVGAGVVAADLTTAYTRRTPAPSDPAHLLVRAPQGSSAAGEPSATLMPDRAVVCRCNGVTKRDLVASWRAGARTVADVERATRATTGCGGCADAVCGLLEWLAPGAPGGVTSDVGPTAPLHAVRGAVGP